MSIIKLKPEVIKQIEHDYYAGALSRQDIVKKYSDDGLTIKKLENLARINGWTDLRVQSVNAVKKHVAEKVNEVIEGVIVDQEIPLTEFIISEFKLNKNHYDIYDLVADEIKDMVINKAQMLKRSDSDIRKIPLTLDDYKTIVDIVFKIQGGQRLAVGIDKNKDNGSKGNQYTLNMFGNMQHEIREQVINKASLGLLEIQKMVEDNLSE